ncbi:zinc finger protein 845-like [Culicoides brevitarsis]|uniref:zinc finger protein 845-like n=1 Tax=Culicoides brevitarsis TaxID=469753 RepID=UPI00307CB3E3
MKIAFPTEMEEKNCPQCLRQIAGKSRLYKDEICGHSKCKVCLLQEDDECKQCSSHTEVVDDHNYSNEKSVVVEVLKVEDKDGATYEVITEQYEGADEGEEKDMYVEEEYLDGQTEFEFIYKNDKDDENDVEEEPAKASKKNRMPSFVESIVVTNEETGEPEHRYQCNICKKNFKSPHQIRYHRYCDESVEKPYKCDECSLRYKTSYQLKQHKQLHVNATYECMECNRTFKHDASAKKHAKKHFQTATPASKKLPAKGTFPCTVCEKIFSRKDYLKKHMICHEDSKRYKCEYCDKVYARNNALKFHIMTAHTERQEYKCKCGKVMTSMQSLARHQIVHSSTKPLKCLVCGLRSSRRDNLFRHIRSFHSDADPKTSIGVEENTDVEDSEIVEGDELMEEESTSMIRSQENTLRKNVIVMKETNQNTESTVEGKPQIQNIEIYRKILLSKDEEEQVEDEEIPASEVQEFYIEQCS